MRSRLYKVSRTLHKYIGLSLLLFIAWMSISGIILNHPELIADISMPGWLVPGGYYPENWNRSALISGIQLNDEDESIIVAGKKGVWKSSDGGQVFKRYEEGLPTSDYMRKAYSIIVRDDELWLGTEDGVYKRKVGGVTWIKHENQFGGRPIKKLLLGKRGLVVVTDSGLYLEKSQGSESFKSANLTKSDPKRTVSLVELFFDLHSGKVWGLPGQLLFDVVGIISVSLCTSGFYIWFYPWRRKRRKKHDAKQEREESRKYGKQVKNHLTKGIWVAAVLIIISFTGIFMRPPLLAIIATGEIPAELYPSFVKHDQWHKRIHNAVYEIETDTILLATSKGFYRVDSSFNETLVKVEMNVPVFVMGATLLEHQNDGALLVGSFSGLFKYMNGGYENLLEKESSKRISNVKPGNFMITGGIHLNNGQWGISTHEKGMVEGHRKEFVTFTMPEYLNANPRISLWNWMFELHNGRIFEDWIGGFYILLVPLGSILFFLLIVTGIIDWFFINSRRQRMKIDD